MHGELICNVLKKNDTSPVSVVISATTKRLHKQKEIWCCSASTWGDEEIFFSHQFLVGAQTQARPNCLEELLDWKQLFCILITALALDSAAYDYDHVDTTPLKGVANILLLKTSDRGGELGSPGKGEDVRSRSWFENSGWRSGLFPIKLNRRPRSDQFTRHGICIQNRHPVHNGSTCRSPQRQGR